MERVARRAARLDREDDKVANKVIQAIKDTPLISKGDEKALRKIVQEEVKDLLRHLTKDHDRITARCMIDLERKLSLELHAFTERIEACHWWQNEWMPIKAVAELLGISDKYLHTKLKEGEEGRHTLRTISYRMGIKMIKRKEVEMYFRYGDIRECDDRATTKAAAIRKSLRDTLPLELAVLNTDELYDLVRQCYRTPQAFDRKMEELTRHPYPLHALYAELLEDYGSHEELVLRRAKHNEKRLNEISTSAPHLLSMPQ